MACTYDIDTTVPSYSNNGIESPEIYTDDCRMRRLADGSIGLGPSKDRIVYTPLIFATWLVLR
jgi:hypothetical protein